MSDHEDGVIQTPQPGQSPIKWTNADVADDDTGIDFSAEELQQNKAEQARQEQLRRTLDDAVPSEKGTKQKNLTVKESKAVKDPTAAIKEYTEDLAQQENQGLDGLDDYDGDQRGTPLTKEESAALVNRRNKWLGQEETNDDAFGGEDDDIGDIDPNTGTTRKDGSKKKNIQLNKGDSAKGKSQKVDLKINSTDNVLDAYSNYTYNFELYILDDISFNKLVDNPNDQSAFTNRLLISTANKDNGYKNPIFEDAFYIEDVEMTSVAPTTAKSRSTNITSLSFKIIEPYGISLLERIEELVSTDFKHMKPKQYTQLPFLLKISFVGYDESGKPGVITGKNNNGQVVDQSTRYLPIKLTNVTFDVNEAGATYSVSAVPYNMEAFSATHQTLPQNVELVGKTIESLLTDGVTQVEIKTRPGGPGGEYVVEESRKTVSERKPLKDIINNFHKRNAATTQKQTTNEKDKKNKEQPFRKTVDTVDFVFFPDMAKSELLYQETPLSMIPNDKEYEHKEFLKQYMGSLDKKNIKLETKNGSKVLRFTNRTSIVKAIETIMLHSEYIQGQFRMDNDVEKLDKKPLKWFKITPVIKLGEWDDNIGRFAFNTTYYITPYQIFNINYDFTPTGNPEGEGYHKTYNYIFTGENTDLLNFDIKYNVAFYKQATLGQGDEKVPQVNATDKEENVEKHYSSTSQQMFVGPDIYGQGTRGVTARDLARQVLLDGPEMFSLNAEIIGDPSYIMQSEIFRNSHLKPSNNEIMQPFLNDGSINYDYGDVLINIVFKFPTDYGDNGLMNLNSTQKYRTSDKFSGIYRLTNVKHRFSGGQFTQTLGGVRLFNKNKKTAMQQERKKGVSTAKQAASTYAGGNKNGEFDGTPIPKPKKNLKVNTGAVEIPSNYGQDDVGDDDAPLSSNYQITGQIRQAERQYQEEVRRRQRALDDLGSIGL